MFQRVANFFSPKADITLKEFSDLMVEGAELAQFIINSDRKLGVVAFDQFEKQNDLYEEPNDEVIEQLYADCLMMRDEGLLENSKELAKMIKLVHPLKVREMSLRHIPTQRSLDTMLRFVTVAHVYKKAYMAHKV